VKLGMAPWRWIGAQVGYRDFKWHFFFVARDPDLSPLRKHPLYTIIEDKIKR